MSNLTTRIEALKAQVQKIESHEYKADEDIEAVEDEVVNFETMCECILQACDEAQEDAEGEDDKETDEDE